MNKKSTHKKFFYIGKVKVTVLLVLPTQQTLENKGFFGNTLVTFGNTF